MTLFDLGIQEATPPDDVREKLVPAAAHYMVSQQPDVSNCAFCVHMIPDGHCEIISGMVEPGMTCDYYGPVR